MNDNIFLIIDGWKAIEDLDTVYSYTYTVKVCRGFDYVELEISTTEDKLTEDELLCLLVVEHDIVSNIKRTNDSIAFERFLEQKEFADMNRNKEALDSFLSEADIEEITDRYRD